MLLSWCARVAVLTAGHCCYKGLDYNIFVRLGAYNIDSNITDRHIFEITDGMSQQILHSMPKEYWLNSMSDLSQPSMDLCVLSLKHAEHGITPLPIGMLPAAGTSEGPRCQYRSH